MGIPRTCLFVMARKDDALDDTWKSMKCCLKKRMLQPDMLSCNELIVRLFQCWSRKTVGTSTRCICSKDHSRMGSNV